MAKKPGIEDENLFHFSMPFSAPDKKGYLPTILVLIRGHNISFIEKEKNICSTPSDMEE